MTYDLEVVTKRRPEHSHLMEFIRPHVGLFLDDKLASSRSNITISRKTDLGVEAILEIWGPDRAQSEDLEDVVTQTIQLTLLAGSIPIPAAQEDTLRLAEAIATPIARRCERVVYHPQAQSIVWPKGSSRLLQVHLEVKKYE